MRLLDVFSRRARSWVAVSPAILVAILSTTVASLATTIHPGDSMYVTVWNHPELSKQVAVDADGVVRIPLSGNVMVGGLDEKAAARKIESALRPYVAYPAVDIATTAQATSIFVSGGPVGVLKYQPGETLSTAISDEMSALGTNAPTQSLNGSGQSVTRTSDSDAMVRSRIDLRTVKLLRDSAVVGTFDTVALAAKGDPGPVLEPGDTIVLRYKPLQVRVLGDVAHPGIAYLSADESVSAAITQAGGLLPTSSSNRVLLERDGTTRSLALGDPAFLQPAKDGDILTIPQAPRVNVVGRVVKPGVVSLTTDNTLLSAVYTAGGPAEFADLRNVEVVHAGVKSSYNIVALTHGDMGQNPVLQDGDTILVPRNNAIDFTPFFGVLGGIAAGLAARI